MNSLKYLFCILKWSAYVFLLIAIEPLSHEYPTKYLAAIALAITAMVSAKLEGHYGKL